MPTQATIASHAEPTQETRFGQLLVKEQKLLDRLRQDEDELHLRRIEECVARVIREVVVSSR